MSDLDPAGTAQSMTLQTFTDAVDRWGPRLEHWPASQAAQGERFLAQNTDRGHSVLAEAERLEQLLQTRRPHHTTPDLARRIAAQIEPRDRFARLFDWFAAAAWRPATAAVATMFVGVYLGMSVPTSPSAYDDLAGQLTMVIDLEADPIGIDGFVDALDSADQSGQLDR